MKEVRATAGDGGLKNTGSILKGEAGAGAGERKVRFADESPALSAEENKAIKDFSKTFDLSENRMTEIFQASKTPEGIKDIDKAYLVNEGEKNPKFKGSSFFKGLLPENDKKVENGPGNPAVTDNGLGEDPFNKRRLNIGGQEKGGGEEKKGDKKKLMFAMGFLFIALIFLATGGAALPFIGGAIGASQGLFIAGAVGVGLVGANAFIEDRYSKGNNNQGGMRMVEGGGGASAVANEGGQAQGQAQAPAPAPAPEKAPGQGQAPENSQAQAPAQAQGQAQAPEKAPGQGQAPENSQAQAPAQGQEKAPAPDLMELMRRDLRAQYFLAELDKKKAPVPSEENLDLQDRGKIKKDLRDFKNQLDKSPKFSDIVKNISDDKDSTTYNAEPKSLPPKGLSSDDLNKLSALPSDTKEKLSKVDQVGLGEAINKLAKNVSKDIGIDSNSEKRSIEAQNLEERPSSSRSDLSSKSWVERTSGRGSRGMTGAREAP